MPAAGVSPLVNSAKIHTCPRAGLRWKGVQRFLPPLGQSVMIILVSVFCHGFAVVAGLTQWLPVILVPEQLLVTPMGNDMVNHCGWHDLTFLLATDTEWMGRKKCFPCPLPPSVVTLFLCGLGITDMERGVFLTVHRTVGNEHRTAGMLAWCVWSAWHGLLLPGKPRFPEVSVGTHLIVVHIQKP